ncbi:hypothetical protein CTR34_004074 [Escherichia coli]|nr:hypothetical protein [Escherichia coli]
MLGGADNPNGELPSYITGADTGEFYEFNLKYASLFIYSFRPYFRHRSARSRANRRQSARGAIPAA